MGRRRLSSLDRIDVKILATLQRHGRSTNDKLARTIGLSPRACLERVRKLEAVGIIIGYQAVIDIAKVSRPINVFAEITLERQANQNRFERRLIAIEEVVECWEVSGVFIRESYRSVLRGERDATLELSPKQPRYHAAGHIG
jgi:DNA-binding Lrp family transcriptional regulator